MLPILNTKLIRLYSIYDQRFHILGLFIKHWSKINKIHGAADNYLSSYALLIMLIHFLQRVVEPKVLPNLQIIEENKEIIYEYMQNGDTIKTNIYFEEDTKKIKDKLKKLNDNKENTDSATSLLIKFFEYYGYNYDFFEQKINISRDIVPIYKNCRDNIAFSIDDPFDAYHNPGKSMSINGPQFNKFVTAMKKEVNYIMNGEYLKRLDKLLNIPMPPMIHNINFNNILNHQLNEKAGLFMQQKNNGNNPNIPNNIPNNKINPDLNNNNNIKNLNNSSPEKIQQMKNQIPPNNIQIPPNNIIPPHIHNNPNNPNTNNINNNVPNLNMNMKQFPPNGNPNMYFKNPNNNNNFHPPHMNNINNFPPQHMNNNNFKPNLNQINPMNNINNFNNGQNFFNNNNNKN